MRKLRRVSEYSKRVAEKTGYPQPLVHLVLMFAWRNIITMIEKGEEVRLKGFGRIYFQKPPDARNIARTGAAEADRKRTPKPIEPRRGALDHL